jgi:hypothetical protein
VAFVDFTVVRDLPLPARAVFDELIDWVGHGDWVPLTRVEILSGDGGPGSEFVATTGIGPAALPDRMRVDRLDVDDMTVEITKIGPLLTGAVRLAVIGTGDATSRLEWVEEIRVPYAPQFLATPLAWAAKRGFSTSITKMATLMKKRGHLPGD